MSYASRILLAAAFVLAASCSKTTTTTANGDKVSIDRSANDGVKMDVSGKNGEKLAMNASMNGVALPPDFPKDYPIQPKSVVIMATVVDEGFSVGINSPTSVDDTSAYYQAELARAGWKVDKPMKMGEGYMLQATKGKATSLLLINGNNQGGSYTQLTVPKPGK